MYVKSKGCDSRFKSWVDKKDLIKKTFPKSFRSFGGIINVKIDLSNYATKNDLKNAAHVDTSSYSLKSNLASLKAEVDKLALTNN